MNHKCFRLDKTWKTQNSIVTRASCIPYVSNAIINVIIIVFVVRTDQIVRREKGR